MSKLLGILTFFRISYKPSISSPMIWKNGVYGFAIIIPKENIKAAKKHESSSQPFLVRGFNTPQVFRTCAS